MLPICLHVFVCVRMCACDNAVYVYKVYVHLWLVAAIYIHLCTQRPEVDVRYLIYDSLPYSLETGFFTVPGTRLADSQGSFYLCSPCPSLNTGVIGTCSYTHIVVASKSSIIA